jgi:hypothetical protein
MSLRTTQQYIEVLAPGSGALRVTRQYIEILAKAPIAEIVTDSLTFVDEVIVDIGRVPFPSLPINDIIVWGEEFGWLVGNLEPYDEIVLVESIDFTINRFSLSDTLTFSENRILSETFDLIISDTITFTEVRGLLLNKYSVSDVITFTEDIDVFEIVRTVFDELVFDEEFTSEYGGLAASVYETLIFTEVFYSLSPEYYNLLDSLNLSETVGLIAPYNLSVITLMNWFYNEQGFPYRYLGDSFAEYITRELIGTRYKNDGLTITETIGVVLEKATADSETVTDSIVFTEEFSIVENSPDTLVFVETIIIDQCVSISDSIIFIDTVTKSLNFAQTSTESLGLVDEFTYTLINSLTTKIYSPFIGDTTDSTAPSPPPLEEETYTYYNNVQIFYPIETMATLIELHGPDLGDIDRVGHSRINVETRGGTLIVYADPIWPRSRSLVLNFNGINDTQGSALLDLFNSSLGVEIGIRDWYGRVWSGIVTNPDTALIQNHNCDFSIQLEADCVRLFSNSPDDDLAFSETIAHEVL